MPTTNITSWNDLLRRARSTMLTGLMGKGFADAIQNIVHTAATYGGDIYEIGSKVNVTVDETDFDNLVREQVGVSIDNLFGGTKLDSIVRDACNTGIAFGFQAAERKNSPLGKADALLEEIVKLAGPTRKLVDDASHAKLNDFIELCLTLKAEDSVTYARRLLVDERVSFDESKTPAWAKFVKKYSTIIATT